MTLVGGTSDLGTIFRMNRDGSGFALVHSFTGNASGGQYPSGSLLESGGVLYGMTQGDGALNLGTIFRVSSDGTGFAILHSFNGYDSDGQDPTGSLIECGGVLYGMTQGGGASRYYGTIFKVNPDGSGYALLHSFTGGASDGDGPYGSLIAVGDVLFGLTLQGGTSDRGTIFRINRDGSGFGLVYSFSGLPSDGSGPSGSLIASGGVLYGATLYGGASNDGTIFRIKPDGSGYALLHSFSEGDSAGVAPNGPLTPLAGSLYGATTGGGLGYVGVLFRLDLQAPRVRRHLARE
jgi:uncharacterized repeat protein (TIGR03803 family)